MYNFGAFGNIFRAQALTLENVSNEKYRKIPNVSPKLIEVFKHFWGGLYSGGLIFGRGLYSEGVLC